MSRGRTGSSLRRMESHGLRANLQESPVCGQQLPLLWHMAWGRCISRSRVTSGFVADPEISGGLKECLQCVYSEKVTGGAVLRVPVVPQCGQI